MLKIINAENSYLACFIWRLRDRFAIFISLLQPCGDLLWSKNIEEEERLALTTKWAEATIFQPYVYKYITDHVQKSLRNASAKWQKIMSKWFY